MKKSIAILSLLLSVNTFAQTDVSLYGGKNQEYGVTYALPKSVIEIEVETVKSTYTPGEFCKYADRYLRLTGISDTKEEHWELTSVKARNYGIPDPAKTYFVKLKDKTLAPLMELTEDGIIKSINLPLSPKVLPATLTPATKKTKPNARDFMTEEILMAGSSAKMAELVAKEIYKVRESKSSLLRGEVESMPKDGASLKLVLDKLDEQEQAMTELFSGTIEKETKTYKFTITPTQDITKAIAFRFSKKLGVLGVNDLAGSPVYYTLTNLKTVPEQMPVEGKPKKIEGIVYNLPGKAHFSVFNSQETLFEGDFMITQFGNTDTLTESLFEKKSVVKVTFNPATGAVVKVDRESTSK